MLSDRPDTSAWTRAPGHVRHALALSIVVHVAALGMLLWIASTRAVRPSQDLGRLANAFEPDLPRAIRFLVRGLGTRETRSNDALSLLMFQPDYLARLLELGEADARARADDIDRFLRPAS